MLHWTAKDSLRLSKICVWLFAALMLVICVASPFFIAGPYGDKMLMTGKTVREMRALLLAGQHLARQRVFHDKRVDSARAVVVLRRGGTGVFIGRNLVLAAACTVCRVDGVCGADFARGQKRICAGGVVKGRKRLYNLTREGADMSIVDVMMARRKMSAGELAERIGITPANLSILKNNKARAVRFSTLSALCKALDCKPGDLLDYEPSPDAPADSDANA